MFLKTASILDVWSFGHGYGQCKKEVFFMDIPSLSVAYSQAKVMNMAGAAVLSMALDSTKQQNATLLEMMGASASVPQVSTQMMEQSVNPNLGANIDICV